MSPTNRYTTIAPLSLVLFVAAVKEAQEDLVRLLFLFKQQKPSLSSYGLQKRHQSDRELNARKAKVFENGVFVDKPWRNIKVGDLLRLEANEFLPADLLVISSSEPDGLAYIETSNLDGETNLKIKQASPNTAQFTSPESLRGFKGYLRSEQPNTSLYTYEGTLQMQGGMGEKTVPMSPDQILLRGAQLRNTAWMYGLVGTSLRSTKR